MTLLGESFLDWFTDTSRWVDAVVKIAAAESDANRALLSRWFVDWRVRVVDAVTPSQKVETRAAATGAPVSSSTTPWTVWPALTTTSPTSCTSPSATVPVTTFGV